jgi:hypothetical protein
MASNAIIKIDAEELMSRMTISVKIIETPRYRFRKWLSIKLIVLAAFVLGCGLEVE